MKSLPYQKNFFCCKNKLKKIHGNLIKTLILANICFIFLYLQIFIFQSSIPSNIIKNNIFILIDLTKIFQKNIFNILKYK